MTHVTIPSALTCPHYAVLQVDLIGNPIRVFKLRSFRWPLQLEMTSILKKDTFPPLKVAKCTEQHQVYIRKLKRELQFYAQTKQYKSNGRDLQ